jgi:hypothetical protein
MKGMAGRDLDTVPRKEKKGGDEAQNNNNSKIGTRMRRIRVSRREGEKAKEGGR